MKKFHDFFKKAMIFTAMAAMVVACSDDAEDVPTDVSITEAELKTVLETDQAAGAADNVLAELFQDNGNSNKGTAKNDECYSAEYTENGFTATFNNCVLNGTDNVNGTLTVAYMASGESAGFTATYTDFYVGNIKVNGTRTFEINGNGEESELSFEITSNITLEMEDESIISESGTKTMTFTFGENFEDFGFTLAGEWTVQADGNTYMVETVTPLEISFSCEYLSKGSMTLGKNGLAVTVDFGDGTCDDKATVIYPDGTEEEFTL
ncbi:hypothetical protein [Allomuricauda sp. SCSIO 65647]|uniref:hypothetical protein n=1 Tax=Allomuricauda sp. SCSIO 65647 TaxID=2908843 RepID=UPI001F32E50A|nr:hypothetical protein [Muricauda sp. SCSIO 65647]UJH67335.1 hypothetical protein L0P89_15470 [Muricauda sp. SCSIO 65647]